MKLHAMQEICRLNHSVDTKNTIHDSINSSINPLMNRGGINDLVVDKE